jgi:hypothetical protein
VWGRAAAIPCFENELTAGGPGLGPPAITLAVDLYSSSAQPRTMVFTKNWDGSDSHMLEIRATGTKDAASSDTRIDVDALVVLG